MIKMYVNKSYLTDCPYQTWLKHLLNSHFGRSHLWVMGGDKFGFEVGYIEEPRAPLATMAPSVEQGDSGSVISPSHDVQVQQKPGQNLILRPHM